MMQIELKMGHKAVNLEVSHHLVSAVLSGKDVQGIDLTVIENLIPEGIVRHAPSDINKKRGL